MRVESTSRNSVFKRKINVLKEIKRYKKYLVNSIM